MGRIEWMGVIGISALVVILFSGMPIIQYLAGVLLVALVRPMYRAITHQSTAQALRYMATLLDQTPSQTPSDEAEQQFEHVDRQEPH